MPHEIAFVDSALQAPVKVLGLRMRPFSIGMEVLLLRQRNPLVILTGKQFSVFTPGSQCRAVQNAALVCYRSWDENKKPEKWLKFWLWRIREFDHGQALTDFLNYRMAGSTFPPGPSDMAKTVMKSERDDARLLGSPFLCRLYGFISRLPEREIRAFGSSAWDFPLGFASFLYMAHLEMEGSAQVENAKEAQIEAEYQKHMADVPEGRRIA